MTTSAESSWNEPEPLDRSTRIDEPLEGPDDGSRRSRSPFRESLRDVYRLVSLLDAMYYFGDLLYKRSLRYSLATAAVCLLGYLGNFVPGLETYDVRIALLLPLVVGGVAISGGLTLKIIPNMICARLVNVAQAADLDLMEDYRKRQQEGHLEQFWLRIYRFEWRLGSRAARIHPHPCECPPEVCSDEGAPSDPDGLARSQFFRRARFAVQRDQPQTVQRYHLGVDLRFFEDWRNGACFDRDDMKLIEQFEASATIVNVKKAASYGGLTAMADLPTLAAQKFWFAMVTRVVAIQVGDAVNYLNRRFNTDYFNAQALLWPGEEDEPWLTELFGDEARVELLCRRKRLLTRVFAAAGVDAKRVIGRIALPSFLLATRLRVRYDPEYLDGSLGYTPGADLNVLRGRHPAADGFLALVARAHQDRQTLDTFLRRRRPELLEPRRAESLRAVRIALHTDRDKLRTLLRRCVGEETVSPKRVDSALAVLDDVVADKEDYSAQLVGLRMHHELTRLNCLGYTRLLEKLWRSVQDAEKSEETKRNESTARHGPPGRLGSGRGLRDGLPDC